jgi:hypothetical protein
MWGNADGREDVLQWAVVLPLELVSYLLVSNRICLMRCRLLLPRLWLIGPMLYPSERGLPFSYYSSSYVAPYHTHRRTELTLYSCSSTIFRPASSSISHSPHLCNRKYPIRSPASSVHSVTQRKNSGHHASNSWSLLFSSL